MSNVKRMSPLVPAAAVFVGLLAVSQWGDSGLAGPSAANAAFQTEPPFNATQQRKEMIEQLKRLNERMASIEAKLDRGINVKVTEMPAGAIPAPATP